MRAGHDLLDIIALCNSTLDNVPLLTDTYCLIVVWTKCSQSAYKVVTKCSRSAYRVLTMCPHSALKNAYRLLTSEVDELHAGCSSPQWIPKS